MGRLTNGTPYGGVVGVAQGLGHLLEVFGLGFRSAKNIVIRSLWHDGPVVLKRRIRCGPWRPDNGLWWPEMRHIITDRRWTIHEWLQPSFGSWRRDNNVWQCDRKMWQRGEQVLAWLRVNGR
ncbi:hypothetical protein LINPERPRIM_LOCUS25092 [Linum perenne]